MDTNKTQIIGGTISCLALVTILTLASLYDCKQLQYERDSQSYNDSIANALINE